MDRAEYNEKRLIVLDQFVRAIGQRVYDHMPPDGQDAMKAELEAYTDAVKSLGPKPE